MADEVSTITQTGQDPAQAAGTEGGGAAPGAGNPPDYTEFFAKLDAILDKRSDGLARSALKDNGVGEEEAREIAAAYRTRRDDAARRQAEELSAAQDEIGRLRSELTQGRIQAEVTRTAGTLGFSAGSIPYLMRLADFSQAVGEDGAIDAEAVAAALNQVAADLPALKQRPGGGVIPIGGSGTPGADDGEDRMRSWFGLGAKAKK